jgi:hypothetical protein
MIRKVRADFNGLFGDVLCLSHDDSVPDERGDPVLLHEGMQVLAYDEDADDEGNPDNIIATGTVARAPDWLDHTGSRWMLSLDDRGVRHESDESAERAT